MVNIKLKFGLLLGLLLAVLCTQAQSPNPEFVGTYSDGSDNSPITELTLNEDGTFILKAYDPIFAHTFQRYENQGKWVSKGNRVTLNPGKKPRNPTVTMTEKKVGEQDSITIRINYTLKVFENEQFTSESAFEFDLLTIRINGGSKHFNLVKHHKLRGCLFSPKVKNQIVIDSTNTFKIAKIKMRKLSVVTYGLFNTAELMVSDPKSNFFEINIVLPVDIERVPRSKKVVIIDDTAYFYERKGKVNLSWFAYGLTKNNK